jgi:hypothetical protein
MISFRKNYVQINDMKISMPDFQKAWPDFKSDLSVIQRDYNPGVEHTIYTVDNTAEDGPLPWKEGDSYLADLSLYKEIDENKQVRKVPVNLEEMAYVGGVWIRKMQFLKEEQDEYLGHDHPHDHITILHQGRVIVEAMEERTEFTAPTFWATKAKVIHKIIPQEFPTVCWCVSSQAETLGIDEAEFVGRDNDPCPTIGLESSISHTS